MKFFELRTTRNNADFCYITLTSCETEESTPLKNYTWKVEYSTI